MFDKLLVQQMTNDLQWCTWMEACNFKIFIDHQLLYLGSHALQIKDFMDVLLSVLFKIDWWIDGKKSDCLIDPLKFLTQTYRLESRLQNTGKIVRWKEALPELKKLKVCVYNNF